MNSTTNLSLNPHGAGHALSRVATAATDRQPYAIYSLATLARGYRVPKGFPSGSYRVPSAMGCASPRDYFCRGLPRPCRVPSATRFRDGHHYFVVTRRRSSYLQGSFRNKIPRRPPLLRSDAPSLIVPTGFLHLQDSATVTITS